MKREIPINDKTEILEGIPSSVLNGIKQMPDKAMGVKHRGRTVAMTSKTAQHMARSQHFMQMNSEYHLDPIERMRLANKEFNLFGGTGTGEGGMILDFVVAEYSGDYDSAFNYRVYFFGDSAVMDKFSRDLRQYLEFNSLVNGLAKQIESDGSCQDMDNFVDELKNLMQG